MRKIPETMKALVAYGKGNYKLELEYPTPECGPDDIIIKTEGCGVCAGDLKCYHGAAMFWGDDVQPSWVEPPFIPGHEFLGYIVEMGENVKGFEIGDGFEAAKATGKTNNDAFRIGGHGKVEKATNHAGGILGGMSDGRDIILRASIKPTPSISATQQTVNKSNEEIDINIHGRHDPIIAPRAVVVVEAMAALTIVDALFVNMSAKMESVREFYF